MKSDLRDVEQLSFSLFNAEPLQFPVLISVPHAGRDYPQAIKENLNVPESNLLRLEDRYADRLVSPAIQSGFVAMIAHRPRAWIDLNRNPTEIDPDMISGNVAMRLPQPSRKVRGGLGLIPRRLTGTGNLWRNKWQWQDVASRIENDHEPYHHAINAQLQRIKKRFGCAVLLDMHSMPPLKKDEGLDAQIVIGDRFGRSSGTVYSELATRFFERSNLSVNLNNPYSGGYMLHRHGDPADNIHALQLEVDRSCYLDQALREPSPNMPTVADLVKKLAVLIADEVIDHGKLEAAE